MRKSQERIAQILGLGPGGVRQPSRERLGGYQNSSIKQLLDSKRGENTARLGGESQQQTYSPPRGNHALRDRSGGDRKDTGSPLRDPNVAKSQMATSMVKQSLADLKSRLSQMRAEKQQVERELDDYERHQY